MPRESHSGDEQLLWQQFADMLPTRPGACPSALELAAWVDGRATGPEVQAVETHLAGCGVCRETVVWIRQARGDVAGSLIVAPANVVAAAKMLIETGPARIGLRIADWLQVGGWGMAAAASIAICVVGYQVGSGRPMLGTAATDEILLSEMSFGLFDGLDEGLLPTLPELSR